MFIPQGEYLQSLHVVTQRWQSDVKFFEDEINFFIHKDSSMMVLVGGLPGSGKTYFATRPAKEIGATLFSSDKERRYFDI